MRRRKKRRGGGSRIRKIPRSGNLFSPSQMFEFFPPIRTSKPLEAHKRGDALAGVHLAQFVALHAPQRQAHLFTGDSSAAAAAAVAATTTGPPTTTV